MDGLELLNSHRSVKASLLIHTTTPASVSVLLQGSWYVYFPPRRVSLSSTSELLPASFMAVREGKTVFLCFCLTVSFFLWDPFWKRSEQNSATAMMRNASWLKKQGLHKWQCLIPEGHDWNPVEPDSSSSLGKFSGHSLSAPERGYILNILNVVFGRWKVGE